MSGETGRACRGATARRRRLLGRLSASPAPGQVYGEFPGRGRGLLVVVVGQISVGAPVFDPDVLESLRRGGQGLVGVPGCDKISATRRWRRAAARGGGGQRNLLQLTWTSSVPHWLPLIQCRLPSASTNGASAGQGVAAVRSQLGMVTSIAARSTSRVLPLRLPSDSVVIENPAGGGRRAAGGRPR